VLTVGSWFRRRCGSSFGGRRVVVLGAGRKCGAEAEFRRPVDVGALTVSTFVGCLVEGSSRVCLGWFGGVVCVAGFGFLRGGRRHGGRFGRCLVRRIVV